MTLGIMESKEISAVGEIVEDGRLRSQNSRPNSGIYYFVLLTYSSIPKRIGGYLGLPARTSEFDLSTSRVANVSDISLAFYGRTRGPLSLVILSPLSFSSICSYVAIGGKIV